MLCITSRTTNSQLTCHFFVGVAVSPTHAPCFTALAKSLQPSILVHGLPVPVHKGHSPSCDENGFFELKQCYKMNCWCTDKWGNKIKHSSGPYDEVSCGKEW